MCVMCLKRADQEFDPGYIETIFGKGNNDGFGLAYVEGERYENGPKKGKLVRPGRIKSVKSMGLPAELKKIYAEHMGKNLIFHLRNATHGDRNEENCHPYPILNIDEGDPIDLVMMHNGTISNVQVDRKFSDSYNFATIHLRNLFRDRGPSMLYEESFRYLVCSLIGANNKLIFLDNRERVTIINYEMGSIHPATGVWLSTKENIQLPKPVSPPVPTKSFGFGAQNHTASNSNTVNDLEAVIDTKGARVTWKQPDGSTWVKEVDGRSHFMPKTPTADKTADEMPVLPPEHIANVNDIGGDKIKKLIKEAVAPEKPEDLEALGKSLTKTNQIELFEYVKEFPVETAALINHMAKTTNLLPEFKESSLEDTVSYCLESSWMAAHALLIAVRVNLVEAHEVN